MPPGADDPLRNSDVSGSKIPNHPKGVRYDFVFETSPKDGNPSCCLTSLMKERETQAACVLAVRMGNHSDNRNIGRLRLIYREAKIASVARPDYMVTRQLYAMRSFTGIRKNVGELFQT